MKILVMGAGAVGAYFGARLQQAGEQVVFCARGDHLRALQDRGLTFTSYQGDFAIAVTAWLQWQLRGDANAKAMFVGPDCGLCRDSKWTVVTKNLH